MNNNIYITFIDFFKRHGLYEEEMFKYIKNSSTSFNYYDESMNIRGIYYVFNSNKELTGFNLCIPHIDDERTAFINIRPYIQAIYAYKNLGKKYKINAESEMIALYFEKLYLQEHPNVELENYLNQIQESIKNDNSQTNYQIALNAQEELEKYTREKNPNFQKMQRKARRLTRKYKSK